MIELQAVEKRYGNVMALKGLDLTVPEGSVFGLIGPNGAGKTTAMLILSSLLARDGGVVSVAGADPEKEPNVVRQHLGYMPDFFGFYDSLNAYEYLEFFAAVHGVPSAAGAADWSGRRTGRWCSTSWLSSTCRTRPTPTSTRSPAA